jgi:hypothetical protein
MYHNVYLQQSFMPHPSETAQAKIGVHITKLIPSDPAIYMHQAPNKDLWWSLPKLANG